jgi:hypothetical protein
MLILLRLTYITYTIFQIYPNKFLANLLAGLRGSGVFGFFPGMSGFPGYSGPGPEILGYKGINTFLPQSTGPIHSFYSLTAPSPSPSPPSLPYLALGRFSLSIVQIE